ncbi:pirin family protein [Parasphingorhabdus sp. DH2-15]|uniref:pirin family protein n=1 Tax=Parasphingorhabdus sp. DH2-15 TaxID=3444112 RepID=UPI003F682F92
MFDKREFSSLGHADHGWLNARHHFSFGQYHDPARMGWGAVRVWNDDQIAAGTGFPEHPHRDMEIITFVRSGAITHKDSLGNIGRTEAGDVQVMSAGTGIRHSEYNLEDEETSLFQIWVLPRENGGAPRWDAKRFPKGERANNLEILASGDKQHIADGALEIRADAQILGATLDNGKTLRYDLSAHRKAYLVVSSGAILVDGTPVSERDGIALDHNSNITIVAEQDSEIIIAETADPLTHN